MGPNTIVRKCAIVKVSFTYRLLSIILVQWPVPKANLMLSPFSILSYTPFPWSSNFWWFSSVKGKILIRISKTGYGCGPYLFFLLAHPSFWAPVTSFYPCLPSATGPLYICFLLPLRPSLFRSPHVQHSAWGPGGTDEWLLNHSLFIE